MKFTLFVSSNLILLFQGCLCQTGCVKFYTDLSIHGHDLTSTKGSITSCCHFCQQTSVCLAYTWNNTNGGTCWLKSDSQPLYKLDGVTSAVMTVPSDQAYSLFKKYDYTNFFDNSSFYFVDEHDPSGGFVNYTDRETAENYGLFRIQNKQVYIAVDNVTFIESDSKTGRNAVRLNSAIAFNSGLFIFSLDHVPTGPGLWPAFWTHGKNWPYNGEIDILEGISERNYDQVTLHTGPNCTMHAGDAQYFSGAWHTDGKGVPLVECGGKNLGTGCGILAQNGTFNTPFNEAGGGVYVMEWDREKFIRVWIFVKPNIPTDILNDTPNPNPATWGLPVAYFPIGPDCPADNFNLNTIVINSDLCGWGGNQFPGGKTACEEVVRSQPASYSDAYWMINYLKIYCKPGSPCPN